MIAEIISVGTELLLGHVIDTNSAFLSRRLAGLGISVYRKTAVGDNLARLSHSIREALDKADVVIITGGIGPTEDDVTREAASAALGVELVEDEGVLASLRAFFAARGTPMPESNRKQALRPHPHQGRLIPNEVGTAPGLLFEVGGKVVVCLPGVPREMELMVERHVEPYLAQLVAGNEGGGVILSRILKTVGIGESALESRILDLAHGKTNPTVATYAGRFECEVRVTAKAPSKDEALAMIDQVEAEIRRRLGALVYGVDDDVLEGVTGYLMTKAGATVATAESCTGGLIAGAITSIAGSSNYFERGYVTYSNASKVEELGVYRETIEKHGAVSRPVAIAMARGAAARSGARIGLAVTGIAGPTGGTPSKPVGTVHIALYDETHCTVVSARMGFPGDRTSVRLRSTKTCIDMLRRHLLQHWTVEIACSESKSHPAG